MTEFTIDDAIERCRDRARISELHHMMHASQEWEQVAVWLERLRDAPEAVEAAELALAPVCSGDTVYDVRERQIEKTREQVEKILEGLV